MGEREEGENEAPRRGVGLLKRELDSSWSVVQIASHTLLLPTSRKRNVTTKIWVSSIEESAGIVAIFNAHEDDQDTQEGKEREQKREQRKERRKERRKEQKRKQIREAV